MNSDIDSFVDLHIHSVFSDGTCTPEELADLAVKQRLAAIALTDHDTADGIPRLLKACKDLNLQTIPGIELSEKVFISWATEWIGKGTVFGKSLKSGSLTGKPETARS